jgi:hypothetical protein
VDQRGFDLVRPHQKINGLPAGAALGNKDLLAMHLRNHSRLLHFFPRTWISTEVQQIETNQRAEAAASTRTEALGGGGAGGASGASVGASGQAQSQSHVIRAPRRPHRRPLFVAKQAHLHSGQGIRVTDDLPGIKEQCKHSMCIVQVRV